MLREQLKNLELQYNRTLAWAERGVGLGPMISMGRRRTAWDVRGFIQWQQGFSIA